MKWKRYPEYIESGVEWLGEVPEHWTLDRIKPTVEGCTNGAWGDDPDGSHDVVCIRVADFDRLKNRVRCGEFTLRSIAPAQLSGRLLAPGDLLIEKSGGGENQPVGKVILFDLPIKATCSNFMARMRPRTGFSSNFLCYLHSTLYANQLTTCSIKQNTGIQNLDSDSYLNEKAALPSGEEQLAIAAFLDRETAKIDTLIAKQERLIELLQEKRQALISHAVTKGLNPDAPMKPSGVAWLGEVPAHWDVKPTRLLARIGNGSTPNRDNPAYWDNGSYPWLNSSVVNQDCVTQAEDFVTDLALRECHLPKIVPPAVLLGITGEGRTRGMATTLMFEATINQHLLYLKPFASGAEVGYLRLIFDMAYRYLRSESDAGGSTKGAITRDMIAKLRVPVPPLAEQGVIAAHLNAQTQKLDSLTSKVEHAIALMREHRTALISAAVTGKIDVREAPEAIHA